MSFLFCFVLFYITQWSVWYYRNPTLSHPAGIYKSPQSVRTHAGSGKYLLNGNKEWVCVNLSLRMPAVSNYSCPGRGMTSPGTGILRFYSLSVCSHHAPWRQMVKTSFQQNPPDQRITLLSSMWRTGNLSFTISQSLLKFMSIESVMLSNHFIPCAPVSFCLQSFPMSRVAIHEVDRDS